MHKLDGEDVEKEVANSVRTMHKTGKAFAQRGLQAYATNCNSVKGEIEEFQKVVPLLVVRHQTCTCMMDTIEHPTSAAAHSGLRKDFHHQDRKDIVCQLVPCCAAQTYLNCVTACYASV